MAGEKKRLQVGTRRFFNLDLFLGWFAPIPSASLGGLEWFASVSGGRGGFPMSSPKPIQTIKHNPSGPLGMSQNRGTL